VAGASTARKQESNVTASSRDVTLPLARECHNDGGKGEREGNGACHLKSRGRSAEKHCQSYSWGVAAEAHKKAKKQNGGGGHTKVSGKKGLGEFLTRPFSLQPPG